MSIEVKEMRRCCGLRAYGIERSLINDGSSPTFSEIFV